MYARDENSSYCVFLRGATADFDSGEIHSCQKERNKERERTKNDTTQQVSALFKIPGHPTKWRAIYNFRELQQK